MPGVYIRAISLRIQDPEKGCHEPIACSALRKIPVQIGDDGCQWEIKERLGGKDPLHYRGQ
jgi:hypothetical protein